MNNEYNDNREYNNALDGLHFSAEAKSRMVQGILDAQAKPAKRRVRRSLPRVAVVGVAAALVLSIGAGAAVAYNKLASESFAGVFGTAHTEIVDKIGRPVGASATAGGVTVTADAIIGDKYHYAITYSIAKDDGTAFDIDLSKTVGDGLLPLTFGQEDSFLAGYMGGEHGGSYFYDADPDDNAIQYVTMREISNGEIKHRAVKAKFSDLCVFDEDMNRQVIAEGKWSLKFDLNFEDASASLPAGQTFELNGMTATIDEITLSPIALRVDYTVDSELQWEDAPSGRETDYNAAQSKKYFEDVSIVLTKTDGTTLDLTYAGGSIAPENGKTVCQKGDLFSEVVPLDEIASLTVGGIEIPLR